MAKRPDDRYQTPAEAAAALVSALEHGSQTYAGEVSASATQAVTVVVAAKVDGTAGWSSVVAAHSTEQLVPPRRPRRWRRFRRRSGSARPSAPSCWGWVRWCYSVSSAANLKIPPPDPPPPPVVHLPEAVGPAGAFDKELKEASALSALKQIEWVSQAQGAQSRL